MTRGTVCDTTAVENFIYGFQGGQRAVLLYLHNVLAEESDLLPRLRYGIPFYYRKSWICYLNPLVRGGVELAFTRGNELSNVQGLLQSNGRKQVSGMVCQVLQDIPEKALREIVQEAILLDGAVPYASKRKK